MKKMMRMTRRTRGVAIVAGALLSIGAVYVSASYVLAPAVSDQGGGVATSSGYEVRGSIGGPVIVTGEKTAASASYSLEAHSVGLITYREPPPPPVDGNGGCAPSVSGARGASQAAGAGLALGLLPALWMLLAFRARTRRG